MNFHRLRSPAILGSADGLGIVMGLIAGLVVSRQSASALWHAALCGGLAELVSMAAAQRQADSAGGWPGAIICGIASALGCIIPAVPYLVTSGTAALIPALALVAGVCAVVTWLRPERGWKAAAQTFGLTLLAGALCAAVALA
jgi:VIT1/CCC1 family predicted Fe2+/Mn2+ transporter